MVETRSHAHDDAYASRERDERARERDALTPKGSSRTNLSLKD